MVKTKRAITNSVQVSAWPEVGSEVYVPVTETTHDRVNETRVVPKRRAVLAVGTNWAIIQGEEDVRIRDCFATYSECAAYCNSLNLAAMRGAYGVYS